MKEKTLIRNAAVAGLVTRCFEESDININREDYWHNQSKKDFFLHV